MMEMFGKKLRNRKGFTLIELIVVIAILGILAAIAVPRLGGFTTTAENRADEASAATIANAIHAFYAETGSMPDLDGTTLDDPTDLEDYLGSTLPTAQNGTTFSISITGNNVTIEHSDGRELYPNPDRS